MRCNNCGWENPDGNQKCEKCNAPLQNGGATSPNAGLHETLRENGPFSQPHSQQWADHTVREYDHTVLDSERTLRDETLRDPQPQTEREPEPKQEDLGGTINPYAGMGSYVPVSRCILKPVIFPGEDTRYAPKPANFKGDHIELNRQSIDPDNNTITSKVQATLTHKNGKWYIQNQSMQKTTYIFADEPVELKSGDIILMGNRTFVFEED